LPVAVLNLNDNFIEKKNNSGIRDFFNAQSLSFDTESKVQNFQDQMKNNMQVDEMVMIQLKPENQNNFLNMFNKPVSNETAFVGLGKESLCVIGVDEESRTLKAFKKIDNSENQSTLENFITKFGDNHIFEKVKIEDLTQCLLNDVNKAESEDYGIEKDRIAISSYDIRLSENHVQKLLEIIKNKEEQDFSEEKDNSTIDTPKSILEQEEPSKEEEKNYFRISETIITSNRQKTENNINAIKLLKELNSENRNATEEEKIVLSKYEGWGGVQEAFYSGNSTAYNELKKILTEKEYELARNSVLNSHYTNTDIIDAIYKGLERMGVRENAKILEPSAGVGNFIGRNAIKNANFTAVELDDISGGIIEKIYPDADVKIDDFRNFKGREKFDVVIGNVPFASTKIHDEEYKNKYPLHDYFINKALDCTKEGGIVAVITSKGTMDKTSPTLRLELSSKAELLGAFRLPEEAMENANTEVITDILFFRKTKDNTEVPDWINTQTFREEEKKRDVYPINDYFKNNPEKILGEVSVNLIGQYGKPELKVRLKDDSLKERLNMAMETLPENIYNIKSSPKENLIIKENNKEIENTKIKPFHYGVEDNKVYYNDSSVAEFITDDKNKVFDKYSKYITARELVNEIIDIQLGNGSDNVLKEKQQELNKIYDEFFKKYGLINSRSNKNLFVDDERYYVLSSLVVKKDKDFVKSDFFTERTIRPLKLDIKVDNLEDAVTVSLNKFNGIDIDFMAEELGRNKEELKKELLDTGQIYIDTKAYLKGEEKYLLPFQYLRGDFYNLVKDIEAAKEMNNNNIADLYWDKTLNKIDEIKPDYINYNDIYISMGSPLIKESDIKSFIKNKFNLQKNDKSITYDKVNADWHIDAKREYSNENKLAYGTSRRWGLEILEKKLNNGNLNVYDRVEGADGKTRNVFNKKETILANEKGDLIEKAFQEFLNSQENIKNRIEKSYNRIFNNQINSDYKNIKLTYGGLNPLINLRDTQKEAVNKTLFGGNTLLDHCVGAGKTYIMITSAMEKKRLGIANKSCFVLPKATLTQFESDFRKSYPQANLLVASNKDFNPENRKAFLSKIALGNYDAVLVSSEQFQKIPVNERTLSEHISKQIEHITEQLDSLSRDDRHTTVKNLVRQQNALIEKLKTQTSQTKKDKGITFEETGIDSIYVDEAHLYKNLPFATKLNVAGINGNQNCDRATDMYLKTCIINEKNKGNVVFATATPISNSISEMYNFQRYLAEDKLEEKGIATFDAWAKMYAKIEGQLELDATGQNYRFKERFRNFSNIPELIQDYKEFASIVKQDDLGIKLPKLATDKVVPVICEPDRYFESYKEDVKERISEIERGSSDEIYLQIFQENKLASIDMRFVDKDIPQNKNGKVARLVENVYDSYLAGNEENNNAKVQAIFSDSGTPTNNRFNLYANIKENLIQKGIPENEIAIIHDFDTEKKKNKLLEDLNNADIRVIIGSTQKLGTGTNFQTYLGEVHHLDVPYRPSDLEQRNGRIIRNGNKNEEVSISLYLTEGSIESYLYQILENKQRFISAMASGDKNIRTVEDCDEVTLSFAELKALTNDNPMIKEKMELENRIMQLLMLKEDFNVKDKMFNDDIKELPNKVNILENKKQALETAKEIVSKGVIIDGKDVSNLEKEEIGERIKSFVENTKILSENMSREIKIGQYTNLDLYIRTSRTKINPELVLKVNDFDVADTEYKNTAIGNVIRLDNTIDKIPTFIEDVDDKIKATLDRIAYAKEHIGLDFEYSDELSKSKVRLAEIENILDTANEFGLGETKDIDKKLQTQNTQKAEMVEEIDMEMEM